MAAPTVVEALVSEHTRRRQAKHERQIVIDALIDAWVELAELRASFRLRWKADMRAIKRWQKAHPGKENIWPDHADLVVWLLGQLEARDAGQDQG